MLHRYRVSSPIRLTRCISIFTVLSVLIAALVVTPFRLSEAGGLGQGKSQQSNGKARKVQPQPPDKEKPKLTLPNLDQIRGHRENHPEIKPAIESTVRSKRKPLQKWDGRKVGDPGTTGSSPQARNQRRPRQTGRESNNGSSDARFNHARRSPAAPPPLPDDNFVVSFVGNALGRSITSAEQVFWDDVLRSAYYQGPDAVMTAAREMGRTIFQSKEYYDRGRSNHDYVYDLYMTYLMRDPSNPYDSGWDFWTSVCNSYGREAVRAAFDACGDFNNLVSSLTPNGGISSGVGSISSARVDPFNQSGNQIQARDAEWSLPLISLPGRAGLDLGLGISYSSLVWTKSGPYLYFDEDISQISPGFHLGFASIQGPYFNPLTHKKIYMLVSSAGRRVELRQIGDGVYEAADSSHLQVIEGGHTTAQEVNWTNVSGVEVNGGTLAATYGYWAAGASSTQMISSGDGYVESTIAETNTYRMVGLANTDNNQSYTDIDFAWYPAADGNLYIYESGTYVGSFGPYAIGDGLRVSVEGGAVKYRKNGQLMYTSSHGPTYPLAVDTSFYNPGSTLNNVVIGNGADPAAPSGTLLLCSSDGTRILYSSYASDWQATQIKDRNGNYLTIDNDWRGDIHTITDTLGRVIYFNSDGHGNLSSITQYTGGGWHTWATFGWGAPHSMSVWNMSGVVGTYHGESVPVLRQVNLMGGSYYTFEYTGVGQVNVIRRYSYDNNQQSYVAYDYDGATTDCPRLNQTRIWASGWNGSPGVPGEVATQFDLVSGNGHRMITPDGTSYIEYYGSGWQNGLVTDARVYAPGLQKQSVTSYTQDNTGVNFQANPRVAETNIYDGVGNRRRTTFEYSGSFGLPYQVTEYDANASSVLRYTRSEYIDNSYYTSRRIVSLPSRQTVYNAGGGVEARTSYGYDAGSINPQAQYAAQHDYAYDTNYYARGNVTEVFRWDASDPDNQSKRLTIEMTYDAAGNLLTTADPSSHTTTLNYGDSFSDYANHNAYAYPGILTDADGDASQAQYNYDFGVKTRTEGAPPAGQSVGAIQYFYYDGARRLYEIYNGNNGSAIYYGYGPNYSQTWASVNSQSDNYSFRYFDGFGRETVSSSYHPSTGTYGTQLTYYDAMGRVSQQSNPTEMYGNWSPSADEAGGWIYTYQTYDWKGRPLVTTNQDGTQAYASYTGCGCAGGEVVLVTDEVGRQQRTYSDVLGRRWKTESLNWNGSAYSTTDTYLNARDQASLVRQFEGTDGSGVYQETSLGYDGYGRLQSKHVPEQNAGTATTYVYNNDDTTYSVTDARGATNTFSYNNRHLVTGVTFSAPAGIAATPSVSIAYDAAGNKSSVSDGTGSVSFAYDQQSHLTSETRYLSVPGRYYHLNYGYNLAGQLTALGMADWAQQVNYNYDGNGRLASVTGSGFYNTRTDGYWPNFTYTNESAPTFISALSYRAWGAVKQLNYGNNSQLSMSYNSRMLSTQYQVGLKNWDGSNYTAGSNYSYYNDGKISYAGRLDYNVFDRKFTYDHVGRIQDALSGSEARGGSTPDGPFRESFGYDVWGNTTSLTHRLWGGSTATDGYSFSNNRRSGYGYDANGFGVWTNDNNLWYSHEYDAAGKRTHFVPQIDNVGGLPVYETTDTYDGAGFPVQRVDTQRWQDPGTGQITTQSTTSYSLHATGLGGAVVATLDAQGNKTGANIYAQGMLIATESMFGPSMNYAWLQWQHTEPATGSNIKSNFWGNELSFQETDPLGADVTSPPPPPDPITFDPPEYLNPKFASQPIEIEGGPSQEYQEANAAWGAAMNDMYDRMLAEFYWSKGERDAVQQILARNPNVGVEYNRVGFGKPSVSGSVFGADAARLLNALGTLIDSGDFLQIGGPGLTASAETRPSMQRKGYDGKQNGHEWTRAEKEKYDKAFGIAMAALTNSDCEMTLRGYSDSSRQILEDMGKNQGFLNYSQTRPISDHMETIAWTAMVVNPAINPSVHLYAGFFDNREEFGLNADRWRALIILHELGHVTRTYFHSRWAGVVGSKNLSDQEVDALIVEKCFTAAMPKGIAD